MLDLSKYEELTPAQCWSLYGWGTESKPNSIVLHLSTDSLEIFCNELNEAYEADGESVFACEIFDNNGDMVGQWFDSDYVTAIRGAFVDSVAVDVMREEDNAEDAVNGIAYEAYTAIFGNVPVYQMDVTQYDALLGIARIFVRTKGHFFGIEWEEF